MNKNIGFKDHLSKDLLRANTKMKQFTERKKEKKYIYIQKLYAFYLYILSILIIKL